MISAAVGPACARRPGGRRGRPARAPASRNGPIRSCWYTAALYACVQAELSALKYLRSPSKLDTGLRGVLMYNCAMTAALIGLGGADYLWWIAVTRLASTATWFIFGRVLHHPCLYLRSEPRPLPRALRLLWIAMFSRANLNAAWHHALHHAYPSVADDELPALARLLDEKTRIAVACTPDHRALRFAA